MNRPLTPRRRPTAIVALVLSMLLLALLAPVGARAQPTIPLEAREDAATGLVLVTPTGWHALGRGIYARQPDAGDRVLLVAQTAPATIDQVWPGLLPQLLLDERPEPIGTHRTGAYDWTLYRVDVEVPGGGGTVRVDLALAEGDGATTILLFQAPLEEAGVLSEAVFRPALDALAPLEPEATPDPATLPYTATEVTFPGGASEVTLAGTLTVPRTPGPHPAIVLVGGSGPQDRDESLRPVSAIKPLALLADALSRAGMVVLRYDDRGVAASTGDYASATMSDFTDDLRAALAWLRDQDNVDPDRVGALGHSEGGVYIASLIEQGEPLAFAVGMAAPATNGVDLMIAQNVAISRTSGADEAAIRAVERFAAEFYAALLDGGIEAAEPIARDYFGTLWDRQPPEQQDLLGPRDAFLDAQLASVRTTAGQPWFAGLLRSDAGVGWAAATMPVLGVFAGKDVQVLADQNAPLMEAQLADGHPASRVVTLPDANHLFQAAATGGLAEYGTLLPEFTPEFLPLVTGWVSEVAGLAEAAASPTTAVPSAASPSAVVSAASPAP